MNELMLGREVDESEFGRLDTFAVPEPVLCTFETSELQALCPAVPVIQPDVYDMTLRYTAVSAAIESKSLKLWLVTFRDQRIFAEYLVSTIGRTVSALEGVADVSVRLTQNIRGGLRETVSWPAPVPD